MSNTKTIEFIEKAKLVHGDKYDYSKVEYKKTNEKVCIICHEKNKEGIEHGEFWQIPKSHLKGYGCKECGIEIRIKKKSMNIIDFIEKSNKKHNYKYDYSKVYYVSSKEKVCIVCPEHKEFWQMPHKHLQGRGCPKCANKNVTNEEFIEKAKKIHDNKYDYFKVEYKKSNEKVCIICSEHGEFWQTPCDHLNGHGCSECSGTKKLTINKFIEKAKLTHEDKYDYSKAYYVSSKEKVCIICPKHKEFWQTPNRHLQGDGCPVCKGFTNNYKLQLLNELEYSDLLDMDPIELSIIIGQGNLPNDFGVLTSSEAGSSDRIATLNELKERFTSQDEETSESEEAINTDKQIDNDNFNQEDEIDNEINNNGDEIKDNNISLRLPSINIINELHSLDRVMYATMDEDALNSLVQYKIRKLWNKVLNNEINVSELNNQDGGKYFNVIKNLFLEEYNVVSSYVPPVGYKFKFEPNLMQKLTVNRLLNNHSYGNWSGTGAGKTLSFIIASREIDARLTLVVALNSTIKQTANSIKEVYPDSLVFTDYKENFVFDRNKHNYLILNYEKFQQGYSEELCQSITNNNQIDFIVVDEVHSVKQRQEDSESMRHSVINRMFGRIRENNPNSYTLVMSATPVINTLYEAKSLLKLMNGLDYEDINTNRSVTNALNIFKQLILTGIRFIPKYDMNITELTGNNMSNLDIDGSHLLEDLLNIQSQNYLQAEKLLIDDKLNSIKGYLRKGVIIYSYFTTDIVNKIENYVNSLGFKVGTYTGEESTFTRNKNLSNFIDGKIDILIGSKPIGTGVDGLQNVCDRMIIMTLPWTDSEYVQLKGRIYRQGSNFNSVEIVIPQVKINLDNNEIWSWDIQRLNLIKNKRTLADCAVDGVIPSKILPKPETMYRKSIESLDKWKERINNGRIITNNRNGVNIDLYPEINDAEDRNKRIESEINEVHRKANTSLSTTTHTEFAKDPESWFRYHALRKERMEKWEEIPYEYIATKIKNKNHIIADFGCGENKFKDCLSNKVYSFDHVAFDDTVTACDMKNVPLDNESIDVAMFSLSLWGVNYEDYIKEAYRVLNYGGIIYIAEPSKTYEEQELKDLLIRNGFEIVGDIENRGKFIYIKGLK